MNDRAISLNAVKDLYCRICMESNLCYRPKETCEDLSLFDKLPSVNPQEPPTGRCEDCKHFRKLPYHTDILGKCIHHARFCPKGDWYCADYEPQESEDK